MLPNHSTIISNIPRDSDNRGGILSIVDCNVKNVSIITSAANTIRSNHYHFEDFHFMYVLQGQIDYFFRDKESKKLRYLAVQEGQTVFTPNLELHATHFPVETTLIVSSKNPRDQQTYEKDTVRETIITHENVYNLRAALNGIE
ncbi:cupin domain-containing protein [Alphaproteobacteria bacterium]|nr:cupin domain-containing protein [Alphaproteobacteria bacterium]